MRGSNLHVAASVLDWLSNMAKTNVTQVPVSLSRIRNQREQLIAEVLMHYKRAREIEDALDLPSRIMPEAAVAASVRVAGAPPEDVMPFEEPRGKIMRRVWDHLIKNPGLGSVALRKALKMKDVPMATALNTLKKNGQIQVRGKRGAYKYFAVTAK